MDTTPSPTRRAFVADVVRAASGSWLAGQLPLFATLAACARDDARTGAPFARLTPAEGRTMRAFAACIIPSAPGVPGAEEAGAAHFVDRALGTAFFADALADVRAGLADLDARATGMGAMRGFASLPEPRQVALLRRIEHEPFFDTARTLVVIGTFADPTHGGNRGETGWKLLQIEHRPSFAAPFGWYDGHPDASDPRRTA